MSATGIKNRPVNKFVVGENGVFILTLACGGVGGERGVQINEVGEERRGAQI